MKMMGVLETKNVACLSSSTHVAPGYDLIRFIMARDNASRKRLSSTKRNRGNATALQRWRDSQKNKAGTTVATVQDSTADVLSSTSGNCSESVNIFEEVITNFQSDTSSIRIGVDAWVR
ncbi:uncharacterized protein LOC135129504 [Zophobas morio]|uniref:uncharacterized protein LOC135129504 n=1 Tax=Zophobas morio TaxID=2755281 RepID=UPI00308313A1